MPLAKLLFVEPDMAAYTSSMLRIKRKGRDSVVEMMVLSLRFSCPFFPRAGLVRRYRHCNRDPSNEYTILDWGVGLALYGPQIDHREWPYRTPFART